MFLIFLIIFLDEEKDLFRKMLILNKDIILNKLKIILNLIDYKNNFCKGLSINRIVIPNEENLINKMS